MVFFSDRLLGRNCTLDAAYRSTYRRLGHILWKSFIQFVPFWNHRILAPSLFSSGHDPTFESVCGPIMRVRRALTELADGKSPRLLSFVKGISGSPCSMISTECWHSTKPHQNPASRPRDPIHVFHSNYFAETTVKTSHACETALAAHGVEFAVCLPVIMVLLLGSMEATSAIFVKQALATSAYEGVRVKQRRQARIPRMPSPVQSES